MYYSIMAELAASYPHRLATGENLFSPEDVANLARYGNMRTGKDLFQMDPGLSYGLTGFAKMIQELEYRGYSKTEVYPHGGHMLALHIVVG